MKLTIASHIPVNICFMASHAPCQSPVNTDDIKFATPLIGVPHCPICHREVQRRSVEDIVNEVMKLPLEPVLPLFVSTSASL